MGGLRHRYLAGRGAGFCEHAEPATHPDQETDSLRSHMNFPLLFSQLEVGPYRLNHRIVMAPLTRMRAEQESFAPRPLNAEYYGQRATPGGLIIAEASPVMATARGNAGTPGIYSDRQIKGWRDVVDAVHARGGVIFLQLWHVRRVSHSSFQPRGVLPVPPSAGPLFGAPEDNTGGGEGYYFLAPPAPASCGDGRVRPNV